MKLTLEKKRVERFFKDFAKGKFKGQRLGQAFYNEMRLDKIVDQSRLHNLWAKDGDHAKRSIDAIFDLT